jgi:hypothetical protein
MAKKTGSITEGISLARSECTSILEGIRKLEAERMRIKRAPQSIEERIASFNETIDRAAAHYWAHSPAADRLINTAMVAPGSFLRFDESIIPFQAAFFGDQLKTVYAKRLRDCATGEELGAAQRATLIEEYDEQIRSRWHEFEGIACQIEAAGLDFDRPGNEPADIYLEWNEDTKNYNEEKLLRIERKSEAAVTAAQKYQLDRRELREEVRFIEHQIHELHTGGEFPSYGNIRRDGTGRAQEIPTKASYEKKAVERLEQTKKKLQILSDRYRQQASQTSENRKLVTACLTFLESKGIDTRSSDRLLRQTA